MTHAVLEATGLCKAFGRVRAVDGVDLSATAGACLGLLGPNGAGKTTTIEMLEGLTPPDAGRVEILGMGYGRDTWAIRERIGVQLQRTELREKLTVRETLAVFAALYARAREPDEVLELVGLAAKREVRVGHLSGGQRQRLSLGCALVNRPALLFLDEPTTGLDPQARRAAWGIVEDFKADGGTVLLTTHFMDEAERLADDLVILDEGRVLRRGSPDAIVRSLRAESVLEYRGGGVDGDEGWLGGLPAVREVQRDGEVVRLLVTETQPALTALLSGLAERGTRVEDLRTHRPTLEDVFVALTGRHLRDGD